MQTLEERLQQLAAMRPTELVSHLERFWEQPPSAEREALLGYAMLLLARALDGVTAERYFVSGYSYARTSRHPEVRNLAEELRRNFKDYG